MLQSLRPLRNGALRVRLLQALSGSQSASQGAAGAVRCYADDSHDDFKPKVKAAGGDVEQQIKKDIESNAVFLYMKGVPDAPNCGFSNMACRILDAYGVKYGSANVLADPELREGIKKFTSWPTIPQIFVKGEFIGGADILMSMHQSGELEKVLEGAQAKAQQ